MRLPLYIYPDREHYEKREEEKIKAKKNKSNRGVTVVDLSLDDLSISFDIDKEVNDDYEKR